jgi:3-oxoacyl-[acyl-carrier-protein] synthase-1
MAGRIVVSAIGIVSALGKGKAANLQQLLDRQSGLRNPLLLQTAYAKEYLMGEVHLGNDELSELVGLPAGDNGYTRTALLAMVAMQELIEQTGKEILLQEPLAFINANTVGGMCAVENMYLEFVKDDTAEKYIQYIDTLDCAESTLNIAKHFGLKPLMATISTACSSSANALLLGSRMIQQGVVKRAICGGCDALSRYTVNGFASLKNVSKEACKPFDQNRVGLNLGEGAGYLLLEREEDAIARGAEIIAILSGYSNSNDAYHPTAPSPDGSAAYRTMERALKKANLQASDIDYINAHGTATDTNDAAEGKAIERMFGTSVPFSSTKPYTGHTLAAAGAIEAIFSIYALQNDVILPNLNFTTGMEDVSIRPAAGMMNTPLKHVLSNSFGFGGNNVSLVFSKA